MNTKTMKQAEKAAKAFLISVLKMESRIEEEVDNRDRNPEGGFLWFVGCKESGQLRRDSLNLTRSLANLRKS